MKTRLLTFSFILYSFSQLSYGQQRIIGGTNIDISNVPWQVSLRNIASNRHFCGASIISKNWVVTAAHCVQGVQANNIRVHAGTAHQFVDNEGVFINCDRVIIHPYYNPNSFDNDIALLHLTSPLSFNSNIQPIRLNTDEAYNAVNTIARLTGWGTTQNSVNPVLNNHLQYVDLPVISREYAISVNSEYIRLTSNMLPFFMEGSAAAQGDSGGPAAINIGSEYFLTGVCSWGIFPKDQNPTVYTKVSNYIDWIYSNILSLSGPLSVCDQATYTVENLPAGATVQWRSNDTSIATIDLNGVLKRIRGGIVSVSASVHINDQSINVPSKTVRVYPNINMSKIVGIQKGGSNCLMYTRKLSFCVNYGGSFDLASFGITEVEWEIYYQNPILYTSYNDNSSPYCGDQTGNVEKAKLTITFGSAVPPTMLTLRARAKSICGNWTDWSAGYNYFIYDCGYSGYISFTLSPNPATDEVTLQLMETDEVSGLSVLSTERSPYEIQLWSGMTMLRSFRTNEPTFQIPMAGLPAGLYFVRVVKDGQTYTQKLIKK